MPSGFTPLPLHPARNLYTHHVECPRQGLPDQFHDRQVKHPAAGILFRDDFVVVIEEVESLREGKRVFCGRCRLQGDDSLRGDLIQAGDGVDKLPDIVGFIKEAIYSHLRQKSRQILDVELFVQVRHLPQDVAGPDCCVLKIRPRLAVEVERLPEVECDDRRPCELQQKVTKGADCNLVRDFGDLGLGEIRVSVLHFVASIHFEPVEKVIGFYSLALPAGNLHVRPLPIFSRKLNSQFLGA